MTDDNISQNDQGPSAIEDSDGTELSAPVRLASPALILSLGLALCLTAGAVIWFILTEPPTPKLPSQAAAIPTEATQTPEPFGFHGDDHSPSQIIRAARRAQARTNTNPSDE